MMRGKPQKWRMRCPKIQVRSPTSCQSGPSSANPCRKPRREHLAPSSAASKSTVGSLVGGGLPSLTSLDLKRELIAQQVSWEISELNTPTALQRFGAPFRSEYGEVAPVDSELPILRYIFVNHVRNFPFLDQAKEKEFWQDKLQVVRRPP
jgi:PX-associated